MFTVYRHTNTVNGKSYIGITNKTAEARFDEHCAWSARGSRFVFQNAIRKHGRDAFVTEVLHQVATVEEAKRLEVEEIARHGTLASGYNMTAGGDGLRGLEWTEERREKLRQRLMGRKLPQELKDKISASLSGENHYWHGRKHSPETIAKMRVAQAGEKHHCFGRVGAAHWDAKSYIATFPDGHEETFTGLAEFCRQHGLGVPAALETIWNAGRRHKGFRFREVGQPAVPFSPRSPGRRLTDEERAEIGRLALAGELTQAQIAQRFGTSVVTVGKCKREAA